jgi:catechol 2,3-dioxygenase-like lactoylglutathione lyase family enzyme
MSDTLRPNTLHPDDAERELIDALLDDVALGASADADSLLTRLETDADLCDYLLDRAILHAGLRRSLNRRSLADWAVARPQEDIAEAARRTSRPLVWSVSAAVCLLVAVAGWQLWGRPCATVMVGIGTHGLATGNPLGRETHELTAGVLELQTVHGARVVIEAPAAFHFESPQRLHMTKGRIAADVPPQAKGFTVVTPSGEAIDLGTRFAVDVPASGAAEVHVFDGEVVTRDGKNRPTSLRDGEAFSLAANATRELRTAAFIRGGEVQELAAAVAAGQERTSREAMRRLHTDPALIAVIDFEGDLAGGDAQDHAAGQYRVVQGRWPGSQATDFTNVGDHLPLDVGGDTDWLQLTVAAWVRLDRLDAPYHSLYHTDGWNRQNPGQMHWMIVDSGVMRLALPGWKLAADAIEQHGHPESRTSVLGAAGRWMHLAIVYDSIAKTARFYVDGRPDGVTLLAEAPPARLGPARVGNWNAHDRKLSGRIDELVFVGRAVAAEEIRGLYEAGAPYRPHSP